MAPFELVTGGPPHMGIEKVVSSWGRGSPTNMASQHLSRRSLPRRGLASHQDRAQEATRCASPWANVTSQADFQQGVAWPSSSEQEPPGEGHRRVLCTASSLVHPVACLPKITCGKGSVAPA